MKYNNMNQLTFIILSLSIIIFVFIFFKIGERVSTTNFNKSQENFGIFNLKNKNVKKESEHLEKKHILLTAATKGFGKDLAIHLAKSKCRLYITGKNKKTIEKTLKELRKYNENVWGKVCDFHKEQEIDEMVSDAIRKMKRIDTLIVIPIQSYTAFALQKTTMKDWKEYQTKNIDSLIYLNNLAIKHMRRYGNGKIINVSTYKGKYQTTKLAKGTEILASNIIENHTKVLSEETFRDGIAIMTIRLDMDINNYNFDIGKWIKTPEYIKPVIKKIDNTINKLSTHSREVIPIFVYAIVSPFHEMNGRIIATNSFKKNKNLQKLINPSKLALDEVYSNVESSRQITGATYLSKQTPFGSSPGVKQKLVKNINKIDGVNNYTKYDGKLLEKLTHIHKCNVNNIIIFPTEQDAIKKIFDLFIGRYQSVAANYPCDSYFYLYLLETNTIPDFSYKSIDIKTKKVNSNITDLLDKINSNTKCIYISSPDTVSGQSITKKEFKTFIDKVPDNIIVFLDQRYYEFSSNKEGVNGSEFINEAQNLFVLRSFNNFYGVQPLTMAYLLCKEQLFTYMEKTIPVNEVNDFLEMVAISCLDDKTFYRNSRKKINSEKKRVQELLTKHDIPWIPSETNYILIETARDRKDIIKALKQEKIQYVPNMDKINGYWVLPISTPKINNKVINTIVYSS